MAGPGFTLRHRHPSEVAGGVSAAKFSPNGLWLATATAGGDLVVCNALTGEVVRQLVGHQQGVNALAWSPDSIHLASACDDCSVALWDAIAGQRERTLAGHSHHVFCVAFNPLGNVLASGSFDDTIRLWEMKAGRLLRTIPAHTDAVTALDFSFDGTLLASGSYDGMARLWDAESGRCLTTLCRRPDLGPSRATPVGHVCFAPNAKYLLVSYLDDTLKLWRWAGPACAATYRGHIARTLCIAADFLLYQEGQSFVVSGSEGPSVYLWELQSKQVACRLDTGDEAVLGVAVNPRLHVLCAFGPAGFSLWHDHTVREDSPEVAALRREQAEVRLESSKGLFGRRIPIYPQVSSSPAGSPATPAARRPGAPLGFAAAPPPSGGAPDAAGPPLSRTHPHPKAPSPALPPAAASPPPAEQLLLQSLQLLRHAQPSAAAPPQPAAPVPPPHARAARGPPRHGTALPHFPRSAAPLWSLPWLRDGVGRLAPPAAPDPPSHPTLGVPVPAVTPTRRRTA